MASNQTNKIEDLKEVINGGITEIVEVLEAYGESYNIAGFMDTLIGLGSNDHVQGILEDIQNLEKNRFNGAISLEEYVEDLEQKMQDIGLNPQSMVNAVNTERDQFLVGILVQNPMDSFRREIRKIISNDRNQELQLKDLFKEIDDLVTSGANDLDGLIDQVKEKLEEFLKVETAQNDQNN